MKRSTGVTVIAVLSLLGSVVTLLFGVFMAWVMFAVPAGTRSQYPGSPIFFKTMLFLGVLMYVVPAIWGIWTSVGLFQLKNWARLSVIVFSVLLILMSGCGGVMFLVIPIPATPNQPIDPKVMSAVRIFMATFAAALVSVGIWWVVFFNRTKVKQQFVPALPVPADIASGLYPAPAMVPAAPRASQRPLSFTILSWFLLLSCLFIPLNIWLRAPAIFLTQIFTGWPAVAYYLVFCCLSLYIGIGLLRLVPTARVVAIWYLVFGFVNMAVFYLAPGAHVRLLDLLERQQAMFPWIPQQPDPNVPLLASSAFMTVGAIFGMAAISVPLYFLITRKEAFEKAGAAKHQSPTV